MTIGKEFRLNRRHFLGLTAGLIQPLAKFRAVVPAPARNVPPTEASLEDDRTVIEVPGSILSENQKPGTDAWQIVNPATNHEIEGFADHVSVNRGDTINLFVNSPYSDYQLRFLRLGWYGGKGAREIRPPAVMPGVTQSAPHIDGDGQIECHWSPTIPLDIPSDWPTGVYLVKLTAASGRESYITFTVRDDAGVADLLFQSSVTTYQAYNNWGGKSLYDYNSTSQQYAHKVSFNRPYRRGYGAGDLFFWEIHLLRFLEREGYDVSYTTDVDTHERGHLLRNHLGFLVVGHDEYWSWEMRRNAETALENGVSLGFFGANACYWKIRF